MAEPVFVYRRSNDDKNSPLIFGKFNLRYYFDLEKSPSFAGGLRQTELFGDKTFEKAEGLLNHKFCHVLAVAYKVPKNTFYFYEENYWNRFYFKVPFFVHYNAANAKEFSVLPKSLEDYYSNYYSSYKYFPYIMTCTSGSWNFKWTDKDDQKISGNIYSNQFAMGSIQNIEHSAIKSDDNSLTFCRAPCNYGDLKLKSPIKMTSNEDNSTFVCIHLLDNKIWYRKPFLSNDEIITFEKKGVEDYIFLANGLLLNPEKPIGTKPKVYVFQRKKLTETTSYLSYKNCVGVHIWRL